MDTAIERRSTETRHPQSAHTSLSRSSSSTKPEPPRSLHQKAIQEIELSKGKAYSEVLFRLYEHLPLSDREAPVRTALRRLANLFAEYGCTDEAVNRVVRRIRETEFTGTTYMPLPNEGAIIRIIQEVNSAMVSEAEAPSLEPPAGRRWMKRDELSRSFAEMWARLDAKQP